jgi:hypothetical protein
MRTLFIICLSLISFGCNNNGISSHHRSYVISKSTETVEDSESIIEQPSE